MLLSVWVDTQRDQKLGGGARKYHSGLGEGRVGPWGQVEEEQGGMAAEWETRGFWDQPGFGTGIPAL